MRLTFVVLLGVVTLGATGAGAQKSAGKAEEPRPAVLAAAQVWQSTPVGAADVKQGPAGPDAFPFRATVVCDYLEKELSGNSPKFPCRAPGDDEFKVKYGGNNAEVYGEVLATRLLWALGFGADRMYPVNVICRGCPSELGGIARPDGTSRFDPATIERKFEGREFEAENGGWGFDELDLVAAKEGGPPRAHVDALKLLAVFLQHTDSKPRQQRIVCRGSDRRGCAEPFLMLSDVGLTFGRANWTNANNLAVHLVAWRDTPVWKGAAGCVGNLPRSLTGSLNNPTISESGRQFLAGLLTQLTDRQLRDLFDAGRVSLRLRDPDNARSGFATVDEWVDAFKDKRRQIVERRCG